MLIFSKIHGLCKYDLLCPQKHEIEFVLFLSEFIIILFVRQKNIQNTIIKKAS